MRYVTLNNGVKMPLLGFGVYQVKDLHECRQSVLKALEIGYRLVDTAQSYGNEAAVGEAIALSGLPREELFVTTKLWISDVSYDRAKAAFYASLERLKLDYLDLYLIHQPLNDYYGAWRAMQELYKEGVIRAIGVSNFYPDRLIDLVHFNEIVPQVNQIEIHPYFQRKEDREVMARLGVQPEAWGPFAEGREGIFQDPVLNDIAAAHGKSVAQVILNYLTALNVVCIPKSVHEERIAENFEIFDFELTDAEKQAISALDKARSAFFSHQDPRTVEFLVNLVRNN